MEVGTGGPAFQRSFLFPVFKLWVLLVLEQERKTESERMATRPSCQDLEDGTVVSLLAVSAIDAPLSTGLRDLLRRNRFAGSE